MPLLREYPTDYLDSTSEFRSETPFLECILSGIYPESNLVFHSTHLKRCYTCFKSLWNGSGDVDMKNANVRHSIGIDNKEGFYYEFDCSVFIKCR